MVEYHPVTAKDQSRIHQFGQKILPGCSSDTLCTRWEFGKVAKWLQTLRSWRRWTHRKSTRKRLDAKEVIFPKQGEFIFPIAGGRIKTPRGDQDLRTATMVRHRPIQRESNIDFLGESEGSLPQPHDSLLDAKSDKWFLVHVRKLHIPPSRWTQSQGSLAERGIIPYSTQVHWRNQNYPCEFGCQAREAHRWLLEYRWVSRLVRSLDRFQTIYSIGRKTSRRIFVVRWEINEKTSYIQATSSMAKPLEVNGKARQAEGEAEVVWGKAPICPWPSSPSSSLSCTSSSTLSSTTWSACKTCVPPRTRRVTTPTTSPSPSQKLRGIYFIDPEDTEFKETIKNARQKLETSVPPAMPCKIFKRNVGVMDPTKLRQNLRVFWKLMNLRDCVWEIRYRIIMKTILQDKVHIHHNTTIWFTSLFLCLKLWNFKQQKQPWTRNGKNWRNFLRGIWRKSEVNQKWLMKQGCRALQFILHHWWTHVIWKNAELEAKHQKYKGRVVLRGDIVKDDSGSYAVFTEQGSSASQMTAAKIMDIISRLPGCDGQATDAVSAYTQVKMEDAHKLLKIPK